MQSDNKDVSRGFVMVAILVVVFMMYRGTTSVSPPTPDPVISEIAVAAENALKLYSETMTGNHRQAADMLRAGTLADLNEAHDWLSQRNADGRKEAFRPLGELFNAVEISPESAAVALDQAADGYERVFNAIKQ